MPIKFKNTTNDNNSFQNNADEIYFGAESPGNKALKKDEVPAINTAQFTTGPIATLKTPFDSKSTENINFQDSSAFYGNESLPIYETFTASLTNAIHENKAMMVHSAEFVPSILIPAKPVSPLAIYANEAAMLAGQASQVSGQYYYYIGSTSAWKWNGTSGGVIGNYTERIAVAGWQEWGTMPHNDYVPSWLKVTGSYLVGANNVNYLHLKYFKSEPENNTDFDFVTLQISQRANGNTDPLRVSKLQLFPDIILRLEFEDTMSPVPGTIKDSGPHNLTVNLTNEAGDLSAVRGIFRQGIKRGVINAYSGARLTIPYNAVMAAINQTSGLYMGVWLKLGSAANTSKRMRLISTAIAWDGSGWRIDSNDSGQISFYLVPTTTSDSSANVRLLTSAPNGFLYDDAWHFYEFSYDPVAKTAYIHRDRVLMASAVVQNVDTTAKDLTADDEWRIFHTSTGPSSICEADSLIIASRFITTEERELHYDL